MPRLLPDETVVLICRPNPDEYVRARLPNRVAIGVPSVLGLLWGLASLVMNFTTVYVAACVIFAVMLVAVLASPGEERKAAALHTYTITNRRIILEYRESVLVLHNRIARRDIRLADARPQLFGRCSIKLAGRGNVLQCIDDALEVVATIRQLANLDETEPRTYGAKRPLITLRLGESILWTGRANLVSYFLSETLLSILWTSVSLLFIASLNAGAGTGWLPVLTGFATLSTFGLPLVIAASLLRASLLRYYVTNERVLVWRPWFGQRVMERELAETGNMKAYRRWNRTGTILLDKCEETFHGGTAAISVRTEVTFHSVSDYKSVLNIVRVARVALKQLPASTITQ